MPKVSMSQNYIYMPTLMFNSGLYPRDGDKGSIAMVTACVNPELGLFAHAIPARCHGLLLSWCSISWSSSANRTISTDVDGRSFTSKQTELMFFLTQRLYKASSPSISGG